MIIIDGAQGEGGGQILRSSLSLSMLTGSPFRMVHIRAKRSKPGLLRQHLTAVQAATAICGAQVEGARLGSQELAFHPGRVTPGPYAFAVGTAGSATLVLQTILPPLLTAAGPSSLKIEGGTHNPYAPPFDFLARAFLPLLNRMGPRVTAQLIRPGFFPAGGGEFLISIEPAARLQPLHLETRGALKNRRAVARVAALPRTIAERELEVVTRKLGWDPQELLVETVSQPRGPGNILLLELESEELCEVFTGFGERGVAAEAVAEQAVEAAREYLAHEAATGRYLADQLLLPLAMAGGGSFTTLPLSLHATTNLAVIGQFLKLQVQTQALASRAVRVTLGGT